MPVDSRHFVSGTLWGNAKSAVSNSNQSGTGELQGEAFNELHERDESVVR